MTVILAGVGGRGGGRMCRGERGRGGGASSDGGAILLIVVLGRAVGTLALGLGLGIGAP